MLLCLFFGFKSVATTDFRTSEASGSSRVGDLSESLGLKGQS